MDEEQVQELDEEIGMMTSSASVAKEALKKHQEAMGMTFEDPDAPVAGDAPDDGLEPWMRGGMR